jgi:hypothetical protein
MAVLIVALIFYTKYLILGYFVFSVLAGPAVVLFKSIKKSRAFEKKHEQTPC